MAGMSGSRDLFSATAAFKIARIHLRCMTVIESIITQLYALGLSASQLYAAWRSSHSSIFHRSDVDPWRFAEMVPFSVAKNRLVPDEKLPAKTVLPTPLSP